MPLNKVSFAIIAISVSSAAFADWVKIVAAEKFTVYAELSTIRKIKTTATMWYLFDYVMAQHLTMSGRELSYLSTLGQDEFDCKGLRKRRLLLTARSKNMGGGDIVVTDSMQTAWIGAAPGTAAETMWKLACGKH